VPRVSRAIANGQNSASHTFPQKSGPFDADNGPDGRPLRKSLCVAPVGDNEPWPGDGTIYRLTITK